MATQTVVLDGVISSANISGAAVANLNAQDASWAVASANNVASEVRASFPSPPGTLNTGANLQTFTVQARKNGGSGTPSFTIGVFETAGGTALATSSAINVTSTSGSLHTLTWDASLLAAADGSAVEVRVLTSPAGGSPSVRASIDYGYLDWAADYNNSVSGSLSKTLGAASMSAAAVLPITAGSSLTLGGVGGSLAGALPIVAAGGGPLAGVSLQAEGSVPSSAITGESSVSLSGLEANTAGSLHLAGAFSGGLAGLAVVSDGAVRGSAALSSSMSPLSVSGTGSLRLSGALSTLLSDCTVYGAQKKQHKPARSNRMPRLGRLGGLGLA